MTDNISTTTKNSQEKQELFKAIWKAANKLRGSIDGWDFKSYVLGTIFYRYLSENITRYINDNEHSAGNLDFKYEDMKDEQVFDAFKKGIISEIGFFLYPSELFCNVVKNSDSDPNLNETIGTICNNIEESSKGQKSEQCFKGLFADYDVNSNKLGADVKKRNQKLSNLLHTFADMNFGDYTDNTIDLLGDAYEYLMGMYASNAGKSGGEYFTPQEVSTLLTRLCILGKKRINKVYDPTCGSGSLLLKSAKILGRENVEQGFFGQEKNPTTYNLCRINMFLHNIGFDKFKIANGNTLTEPQHWDDEPFDTIVSNPPYSIPWTDEEEAYEDATLINDPRFSPAGVLAPKSKADLAFIMHCLAWLSPVGTAAIVCFPGIMYRGGAEQKIREYLVTHNYIDSIIQLPENLFFGTSISTCIMVLKKNKTDNGILFIDASKEFQKETNNNRLSDANIENIVRYFAERKEIPHVVHFATTEDIKENKWNLSVSSYVEKENGREEIDIRALNAEIARIVARENELRAEIDKIIEEIGE